MNFRDLQEKTYGKSGLGKWMNQQSAGGGAGWDRYSTEGEKLGKCGDAKEGEPYSACLSRQKADKLGKKGIASFVRRKREAQKEAGRDDIGDGKKGQKPVYVKTGITDKDPNKRGIQDAFSQEHTNTRYTVNPEHRMHSFIEFSRIEEDIDLVQFPDPLPITLKKLFKNKGKRDGNPTDDVVKTKKTTWSAGSLLPSQDAIYLGKALGMAIGGVKGGDLGSIVSNDKRILDGHHRWAATMFNDPNAKVGGIEVDMGIKDLIPVLRSLGDVYGNERRGNPGGTDINIYAATPSDAIDAVITGKYMNPSFVNREKALAWLKSIGGEAELVRRLKSIQSKVPPPGAPPRDKMPVIDADKNQHVDAARLLMRGNLDVYAPYAKESVEISQFDEAVGTIYKAWVNVKTGVCEYWRGGSLGKPYHTQMIAKNPDKFDITEKQLKDAVTKQTVMPVSDKTKDWKDYHFRLRNGIVDLDWNLEGYMMKKGWAKVTVDVGAKEAEIATTSVTNGKKALETVVDCLPKNANLRAKSMIIWVGPNNMLAKPLVHLSDPAAFDMFLKTGRVVSRTEIGNTMAQFRDSVQYDDCFEFSHLLVEKNEPTSQALWDKAIRMAKKKFMVYPSAYANAWAAKWYKEQGGGWRAVKEETEDKPLIKWFDAFERLLKQSGGNYSKVSPVEMLKLYYKGVSPKDAVKQLKEESCGCGCDEEIEEAIVEEDGKEKKVDLNNPFRTPDGPKKFAVYVKNDKGNVVMVRFGDPNMSIQRDHEERLNSFRARHGCDDDPGPKWKAKYWSCKFWEKGSPITKLLKDKEV